MLYDGGLDEGKGADIIAVTNIDSLPTISDIKAIVQQISLRSTLHIM